MIPPELIELSSLAREAGRQFQKQRFVFRELLTNVSEPVYHALVGPRGAGKTVMLKQLHARSESSFYISLDTSSPPETLFSLARDLSDRGIDLLLLDEVHYWTGYAEEIKKIYDFLHVAVVFSSSSALSLYSSTVDLSRRVRTTVVPSLSFREMLYLMRDADVAPFSIEMLYDSEASRRYYGQVLHYEPLFEEYLQGKNFPFSLHVDDRMPLFRNILETIVNKDLVLGGSIAPEETVEVRRMLSFVGKATVDGINYSSISRNTGLTKYKAEKFVDALERAFVLRRVFPRGANVTLEPKIVMCPPYRLLYKSYDECIGGLREDFFVDMMARRSEDLHYLKSMRGEKTPDYLVGSTVVEVGGIHKSAEQFKGVTYDRKLILTHPGAVDQLRRPLFFVGML